MCCVCVFLWWHCSLLRFDKAYSDFMHALPCSVHVWKLTRSGACIAGSYSSTSHLGRAARHATTLHVAPEA